jgi:predicted ABC-type ATPase
MNPVLLVIAGPNGSGKTTVTVRLRAAQWSEGVEYLNPDDVARVEVWFINPGTLASRQAFFTSAPPQV